MSNIFTGLVMANTIALMMAETSITWTAQQAAKNGSPTTEVAYELSDLSSSRRKSSSSSSTTSSTSSSSSSSTENKRREGLPGPLPMPQARLSTKPKEYRKVDLGGGKSGWVEVPSRAR